MLSLFAFVIVLAFAYALKVRLDVLNRTVAELRARVARLEEEPEIQGREGQEGLGGRERLAGPQGLDGLDGAGEPAGPAGVPGQAGPAADRALPARESLETRIGSRWLLYIGVAAIVVGIAYFEKLAIDRRWIGETARVLQGGVVGLLLVGAGLRFARAGLRLYGQVLTGAGLAILYVSIYAAFNFYDLIGQPAAFVLMYTVTVLAAGLSDVHRSQSLAAVALAGGFATPFLLSRGPAGEVALFGYDAVLVAGTTALARRRDWPALNIFSYLAVVYTAAWWGERYYSPERYAVTEAFLTLFCAMFLFILYETRRSTHPSVPVERIVLGTAPVAYYLASLEILWPHGLPFLVFLVGVGFVGAVAGSRWGAWTRLLFWAGAAAPLLVWSGVHGGPAWRASGLGAWAGIYLLNLAVLLDALAPRDEERALDRGGLPELSGPDLALVHGNGLAAYAGAYLLLAGTGASTAAAVAAGFAAWHGLLALYTARHRQAALHFTAVAFTLLTVAIGLQFHGAWMTAAWAAEGAVLVALGLRERRAWLRAGGLLLFSMAVGRLLAMQFGEPSLDQTPFANRRALCGLFVVALAYLIGFAYRRSRLADSERVRTVFVMLANALTVTMLTSEVNGYWQVRALDPSAPDSRLARGMMLSIVWAAYGLALVVVGLKRRYAAVRYFAIALFVLTIGKVFMVDLTELDRLYRVLSIIGLGLALLASSYLYQRLRPRDGQP
ncbi:MAG TPA: DUF2339 domain-containing protein [Vicinamibacterales bacterium]|nr:DUF2339 domain-containing protein [Vicinamibacterales bacterium]